MIDNFSFSTTPTIIFGPGKRVLLPGLIRKYGTSALILTGARSFRESEHFVPFQSGLETAGVHFDIIGISSEPSPLLIDGIASRFRQNEIDVVVAIGGGSVLDAGKALSAIIPQEYSVFEFLEGVGSGRQHSGGKLPFIALPTTAGTGSEATKNAVLSQVGHEGFKKSLRHENFIPDIALIDPELTLSSPPDVTAACGMDAFTQLLESYTSRKANPLTDALAFSGLKMMVSALEKTYDDPRDIGARSKVSYAALISGITLANAGLGVVHGLASSIGGFYDVPHGVVCGTLIASATRMNAMVLRQMGEENGIIEKYAMTGRLFSPDKKINNEDALKLLIEKLEYWTGKFNIPRLGRFNISSGDVGKILRHTDIKQNPVKLSERELQLILSDRI